MNEPFGSYGAVCVIGGKQDRVRSKGQVRLVHDCEAGSAASTSATRLAGSITGIQVRSGYVG